MISSSTFARHSSLPLPPPISRFHASGRCPHNSSHQMSLSEHVSSPSLHRLLCENIPDLNSVPPEHIRGVQSSTSFTFASYWRICVTLELRWKSPLFWERDFWSSIIYLTIWTFFKVLIAILKPHETIILREWSLIHLWAMLSTSTWWWFDRC